MHFVSNERFATKPYQERRDRYTSPVPFPLISEFSWVEQGRSFPAVQHAGRRTTSTSRPIWRLRAGYSYWWTMQGGWKGDSLPWTVIPDPDYASL